MNNLEIREGIWYRGRVTNHCLYGSCLVVTVELNGDPGTNYVKVIPLEKGSNVSLISFAREMCLLNKDGGIDTSGLNGMAVEVLLERLNDNGGFFVWTMLIDHDYYDEWEEDDDGED